MVGCYGKGGEGASRMWPREWSFPFYSQFDMRESEASHGHSYAGSRGKHHARCLSDNSIDAGL